MHDKSPVVMAAPPDAESLESRISEYFKVIYQASAPERGEHV